MNLTFAQLGADYYQIDNCGLLELKLNNETVTQLTSQQNEILYLQNIVQFSLKKESFRILHVGCNSLREFSPGICKALSEFIPRKHK